MKYFLKTGAALACLSALNIATAREEIVVTAKNNQLLENVLQTTHVFDLQAIQNAQVKDIPQLIDQLAGISVRDSGGRGSATSVFIRGASNSQIIVLIDGVRVGSATLGSAALNSYPVEAIERIEVIKGPFSGIYGADAAAGVIQLFTKKGGEGIGSIQASAGTDSLQEYALSLNAGDERNSFHISAHSEDTQGIDRTSILSGGNDDVDGFEETAISLGGRVSFGDYTQANLNILATDSTVDFDNTFGIDPGLQTENETLSAAVNVSTRLTPNTQWTTTLGVNEDQSITNGSFPSNLTTNRDSLGSELFISLNSDTALTTGVDYYEEVIDSPTTNFAVSERDNKGIFAQLTSKIGSWAIASSVRYDDNSAYGSDTNGSLALSVDLSDNIDLTASYGTAFSAPSFNRLYFPNFGNPDILPEESESVEVKLAGRHNAIDWYVSAYKTNFENLFSFNPVTFLAANIGEAELEGIEVSANINWAEWDISVNADLLSATNKATGVELDDRAERTLALAAARDFGKLNIGFNVKAESDRFDLFGTELSSYALFDIRASYQINDSLKVYANVDNVFDKDYTLNLINATERFNTQGRQAKVTLRYNF